MGASRFHFLHRISGLNCLKKFWQTPTHVTCWASQMLFQEKTLYDNMLENLFLMVLYTECLLALQLLHDNYKGVPSIQYFGVLILSCLACWFFLKSLRHSGGQFSTKGSHGKAYFPWKFPSKELIK